MSRLNGWPRLQGESDDNVVCSPTCLGLRPGRSVGAQGGRSAVAVAAVRPRATGGHPPSATALSRILRPQCVASSFIFSRICGAFNPVRYQLTHVGLGLREENAPAPTGYSVCWEHYRAGVRIDSGRLRVGRVVRLARHHPRIAGRWRWVANSDCPIPPPAHPPRKIRAQFHGYKHTSLALSLNGVLGSLQPPLLPQYITGAHRKGIPRGWST